MSEVAGGPMKLREALRYQGILSVQAVEQQ